MCAPGTANFRVGAIDKSIEARTDQEHGPGDFQTAYKLRVGKATKPYFLETSSSAPGGPRDDIDSRSSKRL
jgi:hypothetical protein